MDTPFIEVVIVPLPNALTPATELEALTGIVMSGRGSPSGFPTETEPLVVVMLVPIVELTTEPVVWLTVLVIVEAVPLVVEAVLPAVPVTEDIVLSTVPVADEMVPDRVCAFARLVTDIMTKSIDIPTRRCLVYLKPITKFHLASYLSMYGSY